MERKSNRTITPIRLNPKPVKSAPSIRNGASECSSVKTSGNNSDINGTKDVKCRSGRYKHIQSKIHKRSVSLPQQSSFASDKDGKESNENTILVNQRFPMKSHKTLNPIFHQRTKAEDDVHMTPTVVKEARKSGVLDLSGKGLSTVPNKVYHLNEEDKSEAVTIDLFIANNENAWWNQIPLYSLNLSNNMISGLSPNIKNLICLTNLVLNNNLLTKLPKEISQLEKLTTIDLSHNKIKDLPKEFYTLPNLKSLNISYNSFDQLHPDLSDLHMLTHLDVSHNNLSDLPSGIGFLVRLNELYLSHNKIAILPADLTNIRVLKKLDLSHNELQMIPDDIGNLYKLRILWLQHNKIIQLPDFDGCNELEEINLSFNNVATIPTNLCSKLPHLRIFKLNSNKLNRLPSEIALLQNLVNLNLSNNNINNLPNSLSTLAHLTILKVDGNPLTGIRRDIIQGGALHILRTLRYRYETQCSESLSSNSSETNMGADGLNDSPRQSPNNQSENSLFPDKYKLRKTHCLVVTMQNLTDVPDDIFKMARDENANIVDFSKNRLTKLPEGVVQMTKSATELIFANNRIMELPKFIGKFERITLLNLSCNQLKTLPEELASLHSLRELNISSNIIEEIPRCVYELKNLEILLIPNNRVAAIDASPQGLGSLKRLAVLNLRNNNIGSVPPELGNLTNITNLDLIGNPFRQPRHQIIEKGTEAIMHYLRNRIPV